jgi:hypothetical protein
MLSIAGFIDEDAKDFISNRSRVVDVLASRPLGS